MLKPAFHHWRFKIVRTVAIVKMWAKHGAIFGLVLGIFTVILFTAVGRKDVDLSVPAYELVGFSFYFVAFGTIGVFFEKLRFNIPMAEVSHEKWEWVIYPVKALFTIVFFVIWLILSRAMRF